MKDSDRRLTPEWLLGLVREVFRGDIGLDPFSEPHNPTRAQRFYSLNAPAEWEPKRPRNEVLDAGVPKEFQGHNSLEEDWMCMLPTWVNPPFSQLFESVQHTVMQSLDCIQPCVLILTPTDPSTEYSKMLRRHAAMDAMLTRRVKCVDPVDGGVKDVARSATVWLLGETYQDRFHRVFSIAGHWVRRTR